MLCCLEVSVFWRATLERSQRFILAVLLLSETSFGAEVVPRATTWYRGRGESVTISSDGEVEVTRRRRSRLSLPSLVIRSAADHYGSKSIDEDSLIYRQAPTTQQPAAGATTAAPQVGTTIGAFAVTAPGPSVEESTHSSVTFFILLLLVAVIIFAAFELKSFLRPSDSQASSETGRLKRSESIRRRNKQSGVALETPQAETEGHPRRIHRTPTKYARKGDISAQEHTDKEEQSDGPKSSVKAQATPDRQKLPCTRQRQQERDAMSEGERKNEAATTIQRSYRDRRSTNDEVML